MFGADNRMSAINSTAIKRRDRSASPNRTTPSLTATSVDSESESEGDEWMPDKAIIAEARQDCNNGWGICIVIDYSGSVGPTAPGSALHKISEHMMQVVLPKEVKWDDRKFQSAQRSPPVRSNVIIATYALGSRQYDMPHEKAAKAAMNQTSIGYVGVTCRERIQVNKILYYPVETYESKELNPKPKIPIANTALFSTSTSKNT
jgi:hypothetical protein